MQDKKKNLKSLMIFTIALSMIVPIGILEIPMDKAQLLTIQGYIYLIDGVTLTAGADVALIDINTGFMHSVVSNADGSYGVLFCNGDANLGDTLSDTVKGTSVDLKWEGVATCIKFTNDPLSVNGTKDWYYKPPTTSAPNGMPDFPGGVVNYPLDAAACTVANCFWWFDGKNTQYDNLVTANHPVTLVNTLYALLGPNPAYSHILNTISNWLVATGLDSLLYVDAITYPNFNQLTEEIEVCSDVILVLHDVYSAKYYLTCAGFNLDSVSLAVSDPWLDMAQSGIGPGRYFDAAPNHWNPANVSHDYYEVYDGPPSSILYNGLTCQIEAAVFLKEYDLDEPPVACFTWGDADGSGSGTTIDFDANCSLDDDGITLYEWDWTNDGIYEYTGGPTANHVYGDYNAHTCALRVTDTENQTNVSTGTVQAIAEVLDVDQSVFNRGLPIRHAADGDWGGAQNFAPTMNTVTKVEVYLRKMGTPLWDLTVELREDGPQATLLDTIVIPAASVPTAWTWLAVDFADTDVGTGSDVFIVIPPAPPGQPNSYGYEWGYALGNQYDEGAFWFTRNGGGLWRDLPTMYEFCFRTYGYN